MTTTATCHDTYTVRYNPRTTCYEVIDTAGRKVTSYSVYADAARAARHPAVYLSQSSRR